MIQGPSLANQPEYQLEEQRARARGTIIRTVLVWTPFFIAAFGTWAYFTLGQFLGFGEGWFLVGVLSVVTFLLGYQSLGAIRDLFRGTREVTGRVTRRWARRDSLVLKSHYVRMEDGKIIRIDGLFHTAVERGDNIRVVYYPSSMVAVTVEAILEVEEETVSPGR